jgi:hypothetical protein
MITDARRLFLDEHARGHSRAAGGEAWSHLEETYCADLTGEELRRCPEPGLNSIAWLLWHTARSEDVAVNAVLRGVPEVFDAGGWAVRLGAGRRTMGTDDSAAEIRDLSARIDLGALRAYRAAVGAATRAWVESIDLAALDRTVAAAEVDRAVARGDFGPGSAWVIDDWKRARNACAFLHWTTAGHNLLHAGEALALRDLALRLRA